MLGMPGFVVLEVSDYDGEVELAIETTADLVGCPDCGAVAQLHDRRPCWVRARRRAAGDAGVDQAGLAVLAGAVPARDVDRDLAMDHSRPGGRLINPSCSEIDDHGHPAVRELHRK
jgi:hypothetical protein